MSELEDRIAKLQARILAACERAGRSDGAVELLPVSKRQPMERIQKAMALGFTRFGENYVQEGVAKSAALPGARFLLIGPLQRNKAKSALEHFEEILTLDRPELAARLARYAEESERTCPVWIQLELWDEASKEGGCGEPELSALVDALSATRRLPLAGFMAIPPPGHLPAFAQLADLRERWQDHLGRRLRLSMGMSADLEAAILAGSDQIRIGSAFFGDRTPRT